MEIVVAGLLIILTLGLMWATQGLRTRLLRSIKSKERAREQARRHLVQGTRLLGRSKPREAAVEADKAISFYPKDAASHILKAFALERQGHVGSALRSLNTALSLPVVKSLSLSEKAEALVKRADVVLAGSPGGKRRLEVALGDLHASLAINPDNAKAYYLLGRCYERKGLKAEARQAFEAALRIDPSYRDANQAFSRL
jgi:Tfp pilus assembly protein PilF